MPVTISGSLMKIDSNSILKEQDWGKAHLETRPLATHSSFETHLPRLFNGFANSTSFGVVTKLKLVKAQKALQAVPGTQ